MDYRGAQFMKMKIGKKLFYALLDKIKQREKGKLKITLYKNKTITKEGNQGEYMEGHMAIALGEHRKKPNWYANIATLAHEYAHHIHEKTRGRRYNEKTYLATYMLYVPNSTKKQRIKYGKITMLDEYQADSDGFKFLKRLSANHLFKDWWKMANWYNFRIKFYITTGIFIEDINPPKELPLINKKYTKKQILQKIPNSQMEIMYRLIREFKLTTSIGSFR